jgi:hypothetical protein
MGRTGIERLVVRWIRDPAFRAAVERDWEAAVRRSGVALREAEWALLRRAHEWALADEAAPTAAGGALGGGAPAARPGAPGARGARRAARGVAASAERGDRP